ncbi:LPS export ABC transporter permease LptG [Orrella marina]|uniref:LPS export ABC transporter permease LptG n=1 Tax=Orrella marina TaxID=2163011 RepID=A0A2R4XN02_9BURK|nr:LPS export ABC transporter permease LptG [Orrella marina]AWB35154.1 LPS export ABC transporter permease LptG [Orrella marina]
MSTARNYLAREIYRSTFVVMIALLGLFSFFTLVDQLDAVNELFPVTSLLYLEMLALPTRLYELLPIGLLVGAILALAGLAQRNELVIFRVSGVSSAHLLRMLWVISIPVIILAVLLSEVITPASEVRYSEANLLMRGKVEGGRLASGYWFKEPRENGGYRIINVGELLASGEVANLTVYEFETGAVLTSLIQAPKGKFDDGGLIISDAVQNQLPPDAVDALSQASPPDAPLMQVSKLPEFRIATSLTPNRLVARILVPERMSLRSLIDYTQYMEENGLNVDRQRVAIWRKLAYPFTLIVMLSIAAPIAYMQTRRGGVAAKIFVGILIGTVFFMVNQLALNVGMLYQLDPVFTALFPNAVAFFLAIITVMNMERRLGPKEKRKKPSKEKRSR